MKFRLAHFSTYSTIFLLDFFSKHKTLAIDLNDMNMHQGMNIPMDIPHSVSYQFIQEEDVAVDFDYSAFKNFGPALKFGQF